MYVPPAFALTDLAALHDAIERYSFAVVVSGAGEDQVASHLPLLIDRAAGPHGTLLGHFARANPQARQVAGQPVLVVFSGPHAYISPRWYEAERVVPTWNYLAVHAYGRLELTGDAETLPLLARTVRHYEASLPAPWQLDEQPPDFIQQLAGRSLPNPDRATRREGEIQPESSGRAAAKGDRRLGTPGG
ncbi:MAG: FMN-binding negative transcriptional regulator [Pirellulaceae bacterium]